MIFFGKRAMKEAEALDETIEKLKAQNTKRIVKSTASSDRLHKLLEANGITLGFTLQQGGIVVIMLNFWILLYLVVTFGCMGTLTYVMVRQYKEVKRPRNTFTQLRWRLFWLPTIILVGLALGLPRLIATLYTVFEPGQIVRVAGGVIVLVGVTLLILGIYTFKEKH